MHQQNRQQHWHKISTSRCVQVHTSCVKKHVIISGQDWNNLLIWGFNLQLVIKVDWTNRWCIHYTCSWEYNILIALHCNCISIINIAVQGVDGCARIRSTSLIHCFSLILCSPVPTVLISSRDSLPDTRSKLLFNWSSDILGSSSLQENLLLKPLPSISFLHLCYFESCWIKSSLIPRSAILNCNSKKTWPRVKSLLTQTKATEQKQTLVISWGRWTANNATERGAQQSHY